MSSDDALDSNSNLAKKTESHPQKNKKRKRQKLSPIDVYRIESADKYRKLQHACSKQLHREAKLVKSFECQKIVRSIKSAKDSVGGDGGVETKAEERLQSLEGKLERTKRMNLDALVQIALKRLGVLNLDPNTRGKDEEESVANPTDQDQFFLQLTETMLRHKRLSSAMDQLNGKVADFRQWSKRREGLLSGNGDQDLGHQDRKTTTKTRKRQKLGTKSTNDTLIVAGGFHGRKRGLDLGGHEGASGIFIGSLSGVAADDDYEWRSGTEGDFDEHIAPETKRKKNRPGQRSRKAKALAIEAKKAGRTWDSSLNWREKKQEKLENSERSGGKHSGRGGAPRSSETTGTNRRGSMPANDVTTRKEWKVEGNAHPSWAAANANKPTIQEFKGKKITFD